MNSKFLNVINNEKCLISCISKIKLITKDQQFIQKGINCMANIILSANKIEDARLAKLLSKLKQIKNNSYAIGVVQNSHASTFNLKIKRNILFKTHELNIIIIVNPNQSIEHQLEKLADEELFINTVPLDSNDVIYVLILPKKNCTFYDEIKYVHIKNVCSNVYSVHKFENNSNNFIDQWLNTNKNNNNKRSYSEINNNDLLKNQYQNKIHPNKKIKLMNKNLLNLSELVEENQTDTLNKINVYYCICSDDYYFDRRNFHFHHYSYSFFCFCC